MVSSPKPNTALKAKHGGMRTYRAPTSPKLVITVTQEIINTAERASSRYCMVSAAVAAVVPYAVNIDSDLATIRFTDPDKGLRYAYQTPLYVRDAIYAFDRGEHVPPFSFHLRGAGGWVVAAHKRKNDAGRMALADWQTLKAQTKALRKQRGIRWKEAAAEIGVPVKTLTTYLTDDDRLPGVAPVRKIETWLSTQTGQKPALAVKSRAHTVRGPAQLRRDVTGKSTPQIVGGRAPPVGARFRQFGLRAFVRKPRPELGRA